MLTSIPTKQPLHGSLAARPLCTENVDALSAFKNMLVLKAYSANTIRTYCAEFGVMVKVASQKPVADFSKEQLQSYLLWLIIKRNYKEAQLHTTINALKFYYEQVLNQP